MSENLMKKEKQEKLNLWDKICKYTPQIAVFLPVVSFVAGRKTRKIKFVG